MFEYFKKELSEVEILVGLGIISLLSRNKVLQVNRHIGV